MNLSVGSPLDSVRNAVSISKSDIRLPSPVSCANMETDKYFIWSDAETKLLLSAITKYKKDKANEGLNWQSVKSKWFDIRHVFLELYPDASSAHLDEFPNAVDAETKFNKDRVKRKAHKMRLMYKSFVEKGTKRGSGKLFPLLFDKLDHLWRDEITHSNITISEVSSEADEDSIITKLDDEIDEAYHHPSGILDFNPPNTFLNSSSSTMRRDPPITGKCITLYSRIWFIRHRFFVS